MNYAVSIEYEQWKLSEKMQKMLFHFFCKNKKCEYEVKNILERLLLCLPNTNKSNGWSTLFYPVTNKHKCVSKMRSEFDEKKHVLSLSDPKKVDLLISKVIVDQINQFLKTKPPPLKTVDRLKYTNKTVAFKDLTVGVSPRNLAVLKTHQESDVIKMICRYSAIMANSQQWGLPFEQYDYLYDKYGVRYEGFASPLNARLMGKSGAKFCSLFYDVDKPFGSIGSFFDNKLYTNTKDKFHWMINPPYTEELLSLAANKMLDSIGSAKKEGAKLMAFYIMPGWFDADFYKRLHNSPCKKLEKILEGKKHYYEYKGDKIPAVFKSIVFVFDSYDTKLDYNKICDEMIFGKQHKKNAISK